MQSDLITVFNHHTYKYLAIVKLSDKPNEHVGKTLTNNLENLQENMK